MVFLTFLQVRLSEAAVFQASTDLCFFCLCVFVKRFWLKNRKVQNLNSLKFVGGINEYV